MPPNQAIQSAQVPVESAGMRLDKVLVELFPEFSRSRLQTWLKENRVLVNGKVPAKGNQKVKAEDLIDLSPGVLEHMQSAKPEDLDLQVVGESPDYWVIDKQAGLVVHPAPGNWTGTVMNGLVHLDPELVQVPRAGIVHRLDRDTSGLMVVARHSDSQAKLIQMLQARIVKRVYLAIVWGKLSSPVTVNKPLGRDPRNRLRMAVVEFGKPAVTHFTPVLHGELMGIPVTAMVCRLETGRTHQIRVHAQHAGFALVADNTYKLQGAGSHSAIRVNEIETGQGQVFCRQALHAMHLSFPEPAEFEPRAHFSSAKEWDAHLHTLSWPEFMAQPPMDLMQLGQLAGLDLLGEAILNAVNDNAALHKASSLVLADESDDEEDEDDSDYDVEVSYVRDE